MTDTDRWLVNMCKTESSDISGMYRGAAEIGQHWKGKSDQESEQEKEAAKKMLG